MTRANTKAKEKLVTRLLEGNDDIFAEFVVVELECQIEVICKEVERLLALKNLEEFQQTDLNDLYHDGKAITRVLHYYTGYQYTNETQLMNRAWDKLLGDLF